MSLPAPLNTLSRIEGGARRMAEIVGVLAKYGLADWLSEVEVDWIQTRLRSDSGEILSKHSSEERIRFALQELGASGVKLGQILSTRPDLIGPKLASELARLQAKTPFDPVDQIRASIERELGEPIDKLFGHFEEKPRASASIGQIHDARLPDGREVVVKVQHDGIAERVERDVDLMLFLAELMENHAPWLRQYQPLATARHFRQTLLREMDFGYEARHILEFDRNFREDPTVHFPFVVDSHSTRRVLTMERLEGIFVSDGEALKTSGADLTEFARRGAVMYLEMIFRDGFYHADPHPGNLLMMKGNVVGVVDCGMVGRIDETLRGEIEGLLLAAVEPDPQELVDIVCRIGSVPPELDREDLRVELSNLIADYRNQPLSEFDLSGALTRVTELVRRYHIRLPQGFAMLLKTLIMLDGTSRQVTPGFSLAELLAPYYKLAFQRRFAPNRIMHGIARSYRDWRRLFDALPRDLSDIISRIREERLEVHLEHRGLEKSVNRLVKGLIASALFIGSAMLLSSKLPPAPAGVSVPGVLGCLVASFLAFQLLRAIGKAG